MLVPYITTQIKYVLIISTNNTKVTTKKILNSIPKQNRKFVRQQLNKLDDKIHFNLKNIESIIIGNLKPALNRIEVYLKENHFRNKELNSDKVKFLNGKLNKAINV